MHRQSVFPFILLGVTTLIACATPSSQATIENNFGGSDVGTSEDAVAFRIQDIGTPNKDTLRVTAQWTGDGETAQFDIILLTPALNPEMPFAFSKGWLIAHAPSKATAMIASIASIHGVPAVYSTPAHVDTLPLSTAILGYNLSRGRDKNNMVAGGFKPVPPGPWMATKLFFADGFAELYLNINRQDGIAEFSVKDPENGSALLPILASVLGAP